METQRVFLKGKFEKHIMCFSDFPFRNTLCVSVGKTLWKSQHMSRNGFFQGKQYLAPAVYVSGVEQSSVGMTKITCL